MFKSICIFILISFIFTSCASGKKPSNRNHEITKFSGEVSDKNNFEKEIGHHLFFQLHHDDLGWSISVTNKISNLAGEKFTDNFASIVTPPYHGVNNLDIFGWHFRNEDNTGPNIVGLKNVNSPQKIREFDFVLNDADYKTAYHSLDIMLRPNGKTEKEIEIASDIHANLIKGHGKLIIHEIKLNNLIAGKVAGIESMKFDVELKFP